MDFTPLYLEIKEYTNNIYAILQYPDYEYH